MSREGVITDVDFDRLQALYDACPVRDGWEEVKKYTLKNKSVITVYRRKRGKRHLYEYLTIGDVHVSAEVFWMVNNDLKYRRLWDNYCEELKVIEEYDGERDAAIYWRVAFPMPFTNRDYVFYREHRVQKGVFMTVAKASPHKAKPPTRDVRVEDFTNDTLLMHSDTGPDWCKYVSIYYDDPKANIPAKVLNWVTCTAIPSYLENLFTACDKYDVDRNHKLQPMRVLFNEP
eukprot:TRINITY_DN1389_c0_g1_i4.p1 TRINITY_DN1389_c0_g1~~TRINITY_DN1389_c0_g1_i4.p1  ORF type:complete len:231 (+),score=66.73 TRINITY_DN1389_c0_g1_i4:124-816(+)